jgi:hypothetical protein
MSSTLALYDRFRKFPFGNILVSRALAFRAPYFSTIHPHVADLRSGHCRDVKVPLKIKDGTGDTVLNAVIVFHISERKPAN